MNYNQKSKMYRVNENAVKKVRKAVRQRHPSSLYQLTFILKKTEIIFRTLKMEE